jgi:hypothetical protein
MSLNDIAKQIIREGFEQGGKLIEMGEFDPMYPETSNAIQAEEVPVNIITMDSELLKELLLWAGKDDFASQNVVDKAVELCGTGCNLNVEHIMDLTGSADYEQPSAPNELSNVAGVVSPVSSFNPVSPIMASYQRRAKSIVENEVNKVSPIARMLKKKIKKLSESDKEYIKDLFADEENIEDEDDKIEELSNFKRREIAWELRGEDDRYNSRRGSSHRNPIKTKRQAIYDKLIAKGMTPEKANSWLDSKGIMETEEIDDEENDNFTKDEVEEEIKDIDFASNTLQGAVDGAMNAINNTTGDILADIDAESLDGDGDGQDIIQQISDIKSKIDLIAQQIGVEGVSEIGNGVEDDRFKDLDSESDISVDSEDEDVEELEDVETDEDDEDVEELEDGEELEDLEDVEELEDGEEEEDLEDEKL